MCCCWWDICSRDLTQINGLVEPGFSVQRAAKVVWWPTFVIYEDGKETWRGKVPNPPSLESINLMEKYLDERNEP